MKTSNLPSKIDWQLSSYHYELPTNLIAQNPASKRDGSRMMRLSQDHSEITHSQFHQITNLLPEDATLVINNTKVLPARLLGNRVTGGAIEALLLNERGNGQWEAMVKRAKRIKEGESLSFCEGHISAIAMKRMEDGHWLLEFDRHETLIERLQQYALPPLPPYIKRAPDNSIQNNDHERYQTCYANNIGAIAAPTAGLHFTPDILNHLREKGIPIIELTLHVGIGTFTPIHVEDIRQHQMHKEYFEISEENMKALHQSLQEKRKLIAVGTTCVRVLETLAQTNRPSHTSGWTDIFIYPPYEFKWVKGLLTNFHLPSTSLMLMVAALYSREKLMVAYQTAIEERYRFYSYGDCMLIL